MAKRQKNIRKLEELKKYFFQSHEKSENLKLWFGHKMALWYSNFAKFNSEYEYLINFLNGQFINFHVNYNHINL